MAGSTDIIEEKYEAPLEPRRPTPALPCRPGEGPCPPRVMLWELGGDAGSRGEAGWSCRAGSAPLARITPAPGAQAGISRSTAVTQTRQMAWGRLGLRRFGMPVGVQGGVLDGTTHCSIRNVEMLGVLCMQTVPFQNEILIAFFKTMWFLLLFVGFSYIPLW